MAAPCRISLVILSYNRAEELRRTVERALALPERPPVIVVDNGSPDRAGTCLAARCPGVELLQLPRNIGASARNEGARLARTPYVAFSDDDTVWAPGSLTLAQAVLDAHPQLAGLCGRVLIGPLQREDPVSARMARSPLPSAGLPGPRLIGFMAGASALRRDAFLDAGGYEPRFFIGGEEELLALELMDRGWSLAYCERVIVHHYPSTTRDSPARRRLLLRNRMWTSWLRQPLPQALATTAEAVRAAALDPPLRGAVVEAALGLPWTLRRRRPVSPAIAAWCRRVALHERGFESPALPGAAAPLPPDPGLG